MRKTIKYRWLVVGLLILCGFVAFASAQYGGVTASNGGGFTLVYGDIDGDWDVDFQDFIYFSRQFGKPKEELETRFYPNVVEFVNPAPALSEAAFMLLGYWSLYYEFWGRSNRSPVTVRDPIFFNGWVWDRDKEAIMVYGKMASGLYNAKGSIAGESNSDVEIAVSLDASGKAKYNLKAGGRAGGILYMGFTFERNIKADMTDALGYEVAEYEPIVTHFYGLKRTGNKTKPWFIDEGFSRISREQFRKRGAWVRDEGL